MENTTTPTTKLDIAVVVTSYSQREIAIETCQYYARFCSQVVFVDEERPPLPEIDRRKLDKRIIYISYGKEYGDEMVRAYEKRLVGATYSDCLYVIHSNHDERYTSIGLKECLSSLGNNEALAFCIGQAVKLKKGKTKFARTYGGLRDYQNAGKIEDRVKYHAVKYNPLAHYALWRKEKYLQVMSEVVEIHKSLTARSFLDEIVFELAADKAGDSISLPVLFWIRNRVNGVVYSNRSNHSDAYLILEKKLKILFQDEESVDLEGVMATIRKRFPLGSSPDTKPSNLFLIKSFFRRIRNNLKHLRNMTGQIRRRGLVFLGRTRTPDNLETCFRNEISRDAYRSLVALLERESIRFDSGDLLMVLDSLGRWIEDENM